MKISLIFILKVLKSQLWLYFGGAYLIGLTFGLNSSLELANPYYLLHLFYFTLVANIFLDGINDYFDSDTDHFKERKKLKLVLFFGAVFSIGIIILEKSLIEKVIFILFILLAYFNSAPPLHFKSRPYWDMAVNFLYALPGILGYYQSSNYLPSFEIFIALFSWTAARHLFSAIPNIESDRKASLKTTAVVLKTKNSLLLCSLLWLMTANTVLTHDLLPGVGILVLIYPIIPILIYYQKLSINKVGRYFPFINLGLGLLLFLSALPV